MIISCDRHLAALTLFEEIELINVVIYHPNRLIYSFIGNFIMLALLNKLFSQEYLNSSQSTIIEIINSTAYSSTKRLSFAEGI